MSSKRLYYVLLGVIALLILGLIGGAYGVDTLLTGQSKTLVDKRQHVAVLSAEQNQLTRAKQDVRKYEDLAMIAKSVVPQDKDQAQTVRQIAALAASNSIPLSAITFPSSTLGTTSQSRLSQLIPVQGISGVYSMQITVSSSTTVPVPYGKFISFLSALEKNRRTAEVTSINLQPSTKDRSMVSFSLVLNEYIKP